MAKLNSNAPPLPTAFGFLAVWTMNCGIVYCDERPLLSLKSSLEIEQVDTSQSVQRWLPQLGADSYRERQQAFLNLWSASTNSSSDLDALIEASMQSNDIEIAVNSKWLRALKQLAAPPAEVSTMLRNLALVRSGDIATLVSLAEQQKWDHLQRLLEIIEPSERLRFTTDIGNTQTELAKIIGLAWEDEQESRIPILVDLLWPPYQAVHSRLLWRDLGLAGLASAKRHPVVALSKDDSMELIVGSECKNDCERAFQLAVDSGSLDKAYGIALDFGRWDLALKALALRDPTFVEVENGRYFPAKAAKSNAQPQTAGFESNGSQAVAAAGFAMLSKWCGQSDAYEAWSRSISTPGKSKLDANGSLMALAFAGRIDEAIDFVKEHDPEQAYETLRTQGNVMEAMASIGWDDWTANGVKNWLDKELAKKPKSSLQDMEITQQLVGIACLLHRLGEQELGRMVDDAVSHWLTGSGMENGIRGNGQIQSTHDISNERWAVAVYVWAHEHRRPYAIRQFQQLLRERITDELRDVILRQLDRPSDGRISFGSLAPRVLTWLRAQRAEKSSVMSPRLDIDKGVEPVRDGAADEWLSAVDDFDALLCGRTPENWPFDWERHGWNKLAEHLVRESSDEEKSQVSLQLAMLALELNRHDLVDRWLNHGASRGFVAFFDELFASPRFFESNETTSFDTSDDLGRLETLATSLMRRRDFRRATQVYDRVARQQPDRMDSVLQLSNCIEAIGEIHRAKSVRQKALCLPIDSKETQAFVTLLQKGEHHREASLLLRHALRNPDRDFADDWSHCYALTLAESNLRSKTSPANRPLTPDSTAILQNYVYTEQRNCLSRLDAYPHRTFDLRTTLGAIDSLWRARAALAIAEEDFEQADLAIHTCHRTWPEQIETPLELIPWGVQKFGWDRVRPWLELYAQPMETHMQRWPEDTLIGNNLAWLYANVDQHLDRARELSRRVCDRLPNDDVYLDTLAEVEFRLGNLERAVEISAKCRQLAPLVTHHRSQIDRFRRRSNPQLVTPDK